jgi:hypothetical protein
MSARAGATVAGKVTIAAPLPRPAAGGASGRARLGSGHSRRLLHVRRVARSTTVA